MTIEVENNEALAGEVLTGHEGFDYRPSGEPFHERSMAESLIEMNMLIHDLKTKIDRIEHELDYHVHLVGDLPHNI
jgi:superfamily II RNA helicase